MVSALGRRVAVLERQDDGAACLDCGMHTLNTGEVPGPCTHARKTLDEHLSELDAMLARKEVHEHD